jgi:PKD repeat protein
MMRQNYSIRGCLVVIFLLIMHIGQGQVIAAIRANGKIIGHGDTINVCKGSSVLYQNAGQGTLTATWQFNNGSPTSFTGSSGVTVYYYTVGFDTTFQWLYSSPFADSTFIIVHVSDTFPNAAFNFSPNNVCGNELFQFTNSSSTGDPLNYLWNFGDGGVSTLQNPTHQFLAAIGAPGGLQSYTVNMYVTNVYNCKDTATQIVTVKKIPDATVDNAEPQVNFGLFNGVLTFKKCSNIPSYNFKFKNNSSTIATNVSYKIQWGDGTPDTTFATWPTGVVINHVYPLGSNTMTVSVTGPDGCIGIKKYIVFLGTNPAGGLASLGNTDICSGDSLCFVITNFANNPPGTSYSFWINDNTATQVFQHPPPSTVCHFFTQGSCGYSSNNGADSYNNSFGAYLSISNPCGSNSASVVPIYVSGKPKAGIFLPTPIVCVNSVVNITNGSNFGGVVTSTGSTTSSCTNTGKKVWEIIPSTGYTIVSGSLGSLNGNPSDGSVWTDGSNNLNILFTATGNYVIKIYVYNDRCGIDVGIRNICVRNQPQASFTMPQHSSCGPYTVAFNNTSSVGGCQGDSYDWVISYQDPQGCATGSGAGYSFVNGTTSASASPSVLFSKAGRYIIRLNVRGTNAPYGCPVAVASDTFYVKAPPVVTIPPLNTICINNSIAPSATVVTCYAPGPFSYNWTFTNGNPATSTSLSPGSIQYSNPGTYPVQLIVVDSSCMTSDTAVQNIAVVPLPTAEGGSNVSFCSGGSAPLGMSPVNGVSYQWSPTQGLNNPNIANPTVGLFYTGAADDTTYTYYVTASLGANCNSNDSVKVTVKRKPVISVSPSSAQICVNNNVQLAASGADNYSWTPAASLNNPNIATVIASPVTTTTYTATGTLTNGCSNTRNVVVTVRPNSVASFIAPDTVKCAPVNINILITNIPFPAGNGTYNWYANNVLISSNTTGAVPSFVLSTPGQATIINLVTISQWGCLSDSMQKTFHTVPSVTAAFTKDIDSSCGPVVVNYINTSSILSGTIQYFWNFGNGVTSTAIQPGSISYQPSPNFTDTFYRSVLKAYNGCDTSYFRDSVKVFARTKARFSVDTTRGCSPFTLHISNTSLGNNFKYYWDFGDGTTDTTTVLSNFTHNYNTGTVTTYPVRLISENQCGRDTQVINIVVTPNEIQPFISIYGNQLSGCAPHLATFVNSTIGATQLKWNFGDGSPIVITPNSQNTVTHLYTSQGNFTVNIELLNDCSDTIIQKFISVFEPPAANFSVNPQTICTSQSITVSNSSTNANAYEWFWDDGSSSSFVNGQHVYNNAGTYNIKLVANKVNPNGFTCTDTIVKQVNVINKTLAQINVAPGKPCVPYALNLSSGAVPSYCTVQWVIYDNNSTPAVTMSAGLTASHLYTVPGDYTVKLIVRSTPNCADSTTYSFHVYDIPHPTFGPALINTCSHDTTVNYLASVNYGDTDQVNYKWYVNNQLKGNTNPFSNQFQTVLTNPSPVQYLINVAAENSVGCADTSLDTRFIIQPLPLPSIQVGPAFVQQQPNYSFSFEDLVTTTPNKTYTWYMGDKTQQTRTGQQITYQYGDTGSFKVKLLVMDYSTGCKAMDSVKVTILYVPGYLYVPNAMCPGCGNNTLRKFLPLGKGLRQYHLRIYTTWGEKVFETTKLNPDGSPAEAWDGKLNGKDLQQATFNWQIEAAFINGTEWKGMHYPGGNKYVKAGFITVIK